MLKYFVVLQYNKIFRRYNFFFSHYVYVAAYTLGNKYGRYYVDV